MAKKSANRKYKDSLFRVIFGEHKEHALSLYNAINKTNYTDVDELKIITLEDALYIDIKNDVGFIFHDVGSGTASHEHEGIAVVEEVHTLSCQAVDSSHLAT